ncbi:MAG: signal peptidase I [Gammaproteobacteria bacterium]|nr:signal peptidase I [Gammaproteobacteria bacterium]
MDFALIMVIVLAATGLSWLFDRLVSAPRRERMAQTIERGGGSAEEAQKARKEPVYVEYARAFFPVILLVFLVRSFIVEPFRIPSGSMLPSLLVGDFILVNKFSYGIRVPVLNRKILGSGTPSRGDVVVFRFPEDPSINYIKRVVGLAGDRIVYKDKKVYVNGELMVQRDPRPYGLTESSRRIVEALEVTEQLGNVVHDILITDRTNHRAMTFIVPDNHYFVMGDNRDRSNDSRYWGYVPDKNLVGKAFLVWFSLDMRGDYEWFWERIVWHRIGDSIQ